MNTQPPKWADRFLRWYCHPKYLEEIEGDIYELFERRLEIKSPRMARWRFIWDVFRFFRWSNIKNSNSNYRTMNQLSLFANYLKLGMRNIRRNLISSSINIFGMAIAISFAVSMFIFIDIELSMDAYHTKSDRIYQIVNYVEDEGSDNLWSDSPMALGPALLEGQSAMEAFSRVEYRGASVKYQSDVFDELVAFVDPAFFEMFDFPMINGGRKVLYDKGQIAISKEIAIKYFAEVDPIGETFSFKFTNGKIKNFVVGAVMDDYPYNSSFHFEFYVPIENFFDLDFEGTQGWSFMTDATFVMLKEGEDISAISDSFDEYKAIQLSSNPEWKVQSFEAIGLPELSVNSYKILGSVSGGGHPAGRMALALISLFLLGMACFNFMNISVVSASKRLKEIALRKVMGSVRKEIIFQFMTENFLKCLFALIIGVLLSYFVLLPWFDALVNELDVKFRTYNPYTMVSFMVILLVVVSLVSGAYPSFYISRFDTITIFRGKEKFGSKNLFSKIMLGFQFFLAIMTIVGCFVMTEQSFNLGKKDWGYDPEGTMSIYVNNEEQYNLLSDQISNNPMTLNHTSSDVLIGRGVTKISLEVGDKQIGVRKISASANYFDTFGLRMKEGRVLTDRKEDLNGKVVVNERFVTAMGWTDAIGKTFTYDSTQFQVIGVVEDFHYYDFFSPIDPVMIQGLIPTNTRYLTVKTTAENLPRLEQAAREVWLQVAPNDPFDRVFQEDAFDNFYEENESNISILMLVTTVAVILACLGLYGLLSFNVQGKLKEFSVRKVLGADPRTLIKIIGKQYFWVLLIAFIVGAPLGALGMMQLVVSVFPEPEKVTLLPYVLAFIIILITLVITITGQFKKAINVNPAELLRSE